METKSKRDDVAMLVLAILFVIFQAISQVFLILDDSFDYVWLLESIILMVISVAMYYTYHTHTKNIMKPLIGAVLMFILIIKMTSATDFIEAYIAEPDYFLEHPWYFVYWSLQIVQFLTIALINIMHYVINASHHSSPGKIIANRVFYIAYGVASIIQLVCIFLLDADTYVLLSRLFSYVSMLLLILIIILIESKLDEYRLKREAVVNASQE